MRNKTKITIKTHETMDQNVCQFDEKFYILTKGTCMGNALSPFLANLFMSQFEMNLKEEKKIPRIWWRYVDDVFAVILAKEQKSKKSWRI